MLSGTLGASLLGNILAGKGGQRRVKDEKINRVGECQGINRAGEGAITTRQGRGIVGAGYNRGSSKNKMDF